MPMDAFGRCTRCFRQVYSSGGCPDCDWQKSYLPAVYGQRLDGSWGVLRPTYDGPSKDLQAFLDYWWRVYGV